MDELMMIGFLQFPLVIYYVDSSRHVRTDSCSLLFRFLSLSLKCVNALTAETMLHTANKKICHYNNCLFKITQNAIQL